MKRFKTKIWRSQAVWLLQEVWIEAESIEDVKKQLKGGIRKEVPESIYDWGPIEDESWIEDFQEEYEWHEHEEIEEV